MGPGARLQGGETNVTQRWQISVQTQDFDPGAEIEALRGAANGAIVSFVGVARDSSDGFPVQRINLEHYAAMTQRCLEEIVRQAHARWSLNGVRLIHRYGELRPGDRIVLVATASVHREHAFDGCRFIIDYLKTQAPFWKQESGSQGSRWVEARASDENAVRNWMGAPDRVKDRQ